MPRFAANLTMMYNEYPFLERFAAAAQDGFQAVEYLFPYEYPAELLASLLREYALQQVLINAPAGNWSAGERGLACLPGREADFRSSIQLALEYAHALNCSRMHVMAGLAPQPIERSRLTATYIANLTWAAEQAAAADVDILIEPINPISMPGYFLNSQRNAHDIVAQVTKSNLKVQMDLFHCALVERDVARELKRYLDPGSSTSIGHIQIAGVPDRHEPNIGNLDLAPLFDLIDTYGFNGWVGLEYTPAAGTSLGLGWLRKSVRFS